MTARTPRLVPLTLKVNLILVASLTLGIGTALGVLSFSFVDLFGRKTREGLLDQAGALHAAIESVMMPGQAPLAVGMFGKVALSQPGTAIMLYRRDGRAAFSDDSTIEQVNRNLGRSAFAPGDRPAPAVAPALLPRFAEAAATPPAELFFRDDGGGTAFFRAYKPLVNLPKCTSCHGSDHSVRGVIDIRTDVTEELRTNSLVLSATAGGFVLVVGALVLVLGAFLRNVVLDPLRSIGRVCAGVAQGKFDGRVEPRSRDEIGELARAINNMVEGLYERFELTKYVSAGTIGALRAGQGPRRVARTLLFTDVRGFTAYSENHDPEEVVRVLNLLLDRQSEIIHARGGDIDKFVGDEIVATFSGETAAASACGAALEIARLLAEREAEHDGLSVGAGIATGTVIHGMVGSARRADYTVIGDSVNVASRLCSVARKGQIVTDGATRAAAGGGFAFRGPFAAKLKGKSGPFEAWLLEARS